MITPENSSAIDRTRPGARSKSVESSGVTINHGIIYPLYTQMCARLRGDIVAPILWGPGVQSLVIRDRGGYQHMLKGSSSTFQQPPPPARRGGGGEAELTMLKGHLRANYTLGRTTLQHNYSRQALQSHTDQIRTE